MSFFMFQLIFAGLAIVLLVVGGLIVRELRRRSASPKARPTPTKAARPRKPRAARTAPEPEPESPPPPRRRQLQSFVENERSEQAEADGPAPATEAPPAPPEADYSQAVLARLEAAFDRLQAGELALDDYRDRLLGEQAAIEERIALLHDGGDDSGGGAELEAALAARESVRWCLDWVDEQERAPG